jgi:glycerol uptake facilitator-like aquaporin
MSKGTDLFRILNGDLSLNQKKFLAEVIGTFIIVVLATGSVVIDAKLCGILGISFIAFAPFVGVAIGVYLFGRISMAHFNPVVTPGFLITKHISKSQLGLYITAEIIGALLGSLFVKYIIGVQSSLGVNSPNYAYPLPLIFGVDALASALLMTIILIVVYKRSEMFRWNSNWRHCRIGYILFSIHIRRINEPCPFISTSFIIRGIWKFMALLYCHICGNFCNCTCF